jgi:chromosome segregation ATPase
MGDREGSGRSSRAKGSAANATSTSTLRRLQTRGEQLLHWFPDLRKNLLREGEPGLESLLGQIQTLRGEMSRRAQATGRDLEARAERLLADLERQAVRGLQPLLSRARVASQAALETLDRRLAHLEKRLGPLLDDRVQVTTRVVELERKLEEAQAEMSERLREVDIGLASGEDLHNELARLREHLDALSKEQVARTLETGKLHDRIVRLEMRFGDLLKEQGAQISEHEEMRKNLGSLGHVCQDSERLARSAAEQAASVTALTRDAAARLTALADERALDHGTLERLSRRDGEVEQTIRQVELRLGDLSERQAAVREELGAIAASLRRLETAARPAAPLSTVERNESH